MKAAPKMRHLRPVHAFTLSLCLQTTLVEVIRTSRISLRKLRLFQIRIKYQFHVSYFGHSSYFKAEDIVGEVEQDVYRYYRFADQYEASIRRDVFRELIARFRELAKTLEGYIRSEYTIQGFNDDEPLFPIYIHPVKERYDANKVNGKILDYISTVDRLRAEQLAPPEVAETFNTEYGKVMLSIMKLLDYNRSRTSGKD
ncbi:uncharacterized protein LOC135400998 isoform X2 [Ornithodoros turicata]|uniref:uncharacterized protein LOC135400998 isoform X2 n=1 Tax=Ornithodoros turicata TaxID=34597 RepID=UPI00313957D1